MAAKVNIAKHPVHPMLVTFPIGLWIFSLVSDIIARAGGDPVWNTVAWYSMGGGIVGAIAAALPGFIDLVSMKASPAKRIGIAHAILNVFALIVFVVDFLVRASTGPGTLPFILSILGVGIITVSGWLGGSMVYMHRVAVEPPGAREELPEQWRKAA